MSSVVFVIALLLFQPVYYCNIIISRFALLNLFCKSNNIFQLLIWVIFTLEGVCYLVACFKIDLNNMNKILCCVLIDYHRFGTFPKFIIPKKVKTISLVENKCNFKLYLLSICFLTQIQILKIRQDLNNLNHLAVCEHLSRFIEHYRYFAFKEWIISLQKEVDDNLYNEKLKENKFVLRILMQYNFYGSKNVHLGPQWV